MNIFRIAYVAMIISISDDFPTYVKFQFFYTYISYTYKYKREVETLLKWHGRWTHLKICSKSRIIKVE